jgi:peroxiredoxin
MNKFLGTFCIVALLASCNNKTGNRQFEVSGTLVNASGKTVYLIENSMFSRGRGIADSAIVGNNGSYILKTKANEAISYTLYIGGSNTPFATVINDVNKITLNATFKPDNIHNAESYEVKGSKASGDAKEFLKGITLKMQEISVLDGKADSLHRAGVPDSLLSVMMKERGKLTADLKNFVSISITRAENPALIFYELSNYQGSAYQFGLQPIPDEEVDNIISQAAKKYPEHEGWAYIKTKSEEEKMRRQEEEQREKEKSWVGKQAPEIAMPDPNGNEVKLSSYRGKYVLVDFWASWCTPCRHENPNVVAAYKKFKGKNFDILGVSLDRPGEKDNWLFAIKQDNLSWTQVSDLKEWNSSVVSVYGFGQEGIPYNILVDPQGKIIAERITGPLLDEKLAEVLK